MSNGYELAAYALRYWFIAAALAILIAVIYISYKEYAAKKYAFSQIEKFGGYLKIIGGPQNFIGDRFGLAEENRIGSDNRNNIIIPDRTVAPAHLIIEMREGDFYAQPVSNADVYVNGRPAADSVRLKTGDRIEIGDILLGVYFKRTRLTDEH